MKGRTRKDLAVGDLISISEAAHTLVQCIRSYEMVETETVFTRSEKSGSSAKRKGDLDRSKR